MNRAATPPDEMRIESLRLVGLGVGLLGFASFLLLLPLMMILVDPPPIVLWRTWKRRLPHLLRRIPR